ncbi:LolA family protein [Candidatus Electronema sp. PJ]|uniref:LolA family protein n=1 Tax=Candidatus Electronema sp. PJ TaxID=3401572 RepID=UPI003AA7B8CA
MSNLAFRNFFILPLLLLVLLAADLRGVRAASETGLLQQVEKIQQLYRSQTSFSFDFRQIVRSGRRDRHGTGSSVFYRPGNGKPGIMRWNYTEPDKQIILNDGKQLSVYTEKDKQVLVSSAAELESDITASLFAGSRNLTDDFNVQPAESRFASGIGAAGQDVQIVQLVPKKPHGQIKTVHVWFDNKSMIRKLVMEDHFDTLTELVFNNIKFNELPAGSSKVTEELVRLNLPPGTEIVKQ